MGAAPCHAPSCNTIASPHHATPHVDTAEKRNLLLLMEIYRHAFLTKRATRMAEAHHKRRACAAFTYGYAAAVDLDARLRNRRKITQCATWSAPIKPAAAQQ
jgi:hypothetical protein